MANTKEIQDRIKSINDTLKITNAMYMISSSKLKKSKKMLADTEPYFFTLQPMLKPNNYTESCMINEADGWRGRNVWYLGRSVRYALKEVTIA